MNRPVYFDVLDTDRTAILGGEAAEECISLGRTELQVATLRGWTPVFPRTYGWDSAALLTYASEKDLEGASFRWLLSNGQIRVLRRGGLSVLEAALAAFDDPKGYPLFAAWPELNAANLDVDRAAVVRAMRARQKDSSVPDEVWERFQTLIQVNEAAMKPVDTPDEQPRENKLKALLETATKAAKLSDHQTADILADVISLPNPDNRSQIDTFLKEEEHRARRVPPAVREITNACFNVIAAECVGVGSHAALTMQPSAPIAQDVIFAVLPGSTRSELFKGSLTDPELSSLKKNLEPLTWSKVRECVNNWNDLKLEERDRQAVTARLLANVAVDAGAPRYVAFAAGLFSGALIWGVANYATTKISGSGAGAIIGALAGCLGGLKVDSTVKHKMVGHFEKKYLALIQSRTLPTHLEQPAR